MFVITFKLTIVSIMSSFSVVGIVFPCGLIVIYMIVNIILSIDLYCILNKLCDPKLAHVCLWIYTSILWHHSIA